MDRRLILVCWLLGCFTYAQAQKYTNEFLQIGVGARAHSMAGVSVASVQDVTATFWNPAALSLIESNLQVGAMHAEWFAGIAKYDYLGIAKPLSGKGRAALGFSIIRLGIDEIPNTLNLVEPDGSINYDNLSEFSAADYAFFLSYGRRLSVSKQGKFYIGGSAKLIRRTIGNFGGAWGFGLDASALWKKKTWSVGLMARDLSFTFVAWSFNLTEDEERIFIQTGNDVPSSSVENAKPLIILGTQKEFPLHSDLVLRLALDAQFSTDGRRNVLINGDWLNVEPALGLEIGFKKLIYLRSGVGQFQQYLDLDTNNLAWSFQPNFGLGLSLGRFQVDYALTDVGNFSQALFSHIFSLSLDFHVKD